MNIIVTGATGLVGRSLVTALLNHQHTVTVIGRTVDKIRRTFKDTVDAYTWEQMDTLSTDQFNAVINLAGENIADNRWNKAVKDWIKNSRNRSTSKIVAWCLSGSNKHIHLYNASAIGIYGLQDATDQRPPALSELDPVPKSQPNCFLREVGEAWENAVNPALQAGFPVTLLRFAVVLKKNAGILGKLALPFSLGAGCILGKGSQVFSWVHVDDLVQAILFLLSNPGIIGPVNIVAPQAVSQQEFAKTLASVMRRPLFLKLPAAWIKIIFGQMGEELLLGGQNVYPDRLLKSGFQFRYPDLLSALKAQ